jgi:hypothetical protein
LQIEKEYLIERHHGNRYTCKGNSRTARRRADVDKPSRESARAAGMGYNTYAKWKFIELKKTKKREAEILMTLI